MPLEPVLSCHGKAEALRLCGTRWFKKPLKPKKAWKEISLNRIAAAAGMAVTPMACIVRWGSNRGVYTMAVDGVDLACLMMHAQRGHSVEQWLGRIHHEDLQCIAMLDVLCGNYRHAGNIVVSPEGRVRGIDHEYAFSGKKHPQTSKIDGVIIGDVM